MAGLLCRPPIDSAFADLLGRFVCMGPRDKPGDDERGEGYAARRISISDVKRWNTATGSALSALQSR